MTTRKKIQVRNIVFLLLIGLTILAAWLLWCTDPNMVRRWIYPIKGELGAWSTKCTSGAPSWISRATGSLAKEFASPANQIVFIAASGEMHGCVNGWIGTPVLSERVDMHTRFRLASLSKAVSFVGMVQSDKQWLNAKLVDSLGLRGPFVDPRLADVRIRHLLDHSAGFDRKRSEDAMVVRGKKPWCPYSPKVLADTRLDFEPGTRFAYTNIGHCLAASGFEHRFGKSLWRTLEDELSLFSYGLNYLEVVDSPVQFNFMNEGFYDEHFVEYFDWYALRGSMGLTGNALGLARFLRNNREQLEFARQMHSKTRGCEETKPEGCYDGFLERRRLSDDRLMWNQKGYLYGMSSMFVMDELGNMLVWLGSGMEPGGQAYEFVQDSLAEALR